MECLGEMGGVVYDLSPLAAGSQENVHRIVASIKRVTFLACGTILNVTTGSKWQLYCSGLCFFMAGRQAGSFQCVRMDACLLDTLNVYFFI